MKKIRPIVALFIMMLTAALSKGENSKIVSQAKPISSCDETGGTNCGQCSSQ